MKKIGVCILLQCLAFKIQGSNDDEKSEEDIVGSSLLPEEEFIKEGVDGEELDPFEVDHSTNNILGEETIETKPYGNEPNIIMDDGAFYATFIQEFLEQISSTKQEKIIEQKLQELGNQLETLGTVDVFFTILWYMMKYSNAININMNEITINNINGSGDKMIVIFQEKTIECHRDNKKFIVILTESKYKCLMTFLKVLGNINDNIRTFSPLESFFVTINLQKYIQKNNIQAPINLISSKPILSSNNKKKKVKGAINTNKMNKKILGNTPSKKANMIKKTKDKPNTIHKHKKVAHNNKKTGIKKKTPTPIIKK